MAISFPPSQIPNVAPGEMLWQVRKGTRRAEACVRVLAHGLELRITVDALDIFNTLKRDTDRAALLREADVHLAAFVERGWIPQRRNPSAALGACATTA